MLIHMISYFIGILIIFGSHVFTLTYPKQKIISMKLHCYINIFALIMIAYYFMWRENYIKF